MPACSFQSLWCFEKNSCHEVCIIWSYCLWGLVLQQDDSIKQVAKKTEHRWQTIKLQNIFILPTIVHQMHERLYAVCPLLLVWTTMPLTISGNTVLVWLDYFVTMVINTTDFWNMMPCWLVICYQCFGGACWLCLHSSLINEEGSSKLLQNTGSKLPIDRVS